jgi:hypothetical protein
MKKNNNADFISPAVFNWFAQFKGLPGGINSCLNSSPRQQVALTFRWSIIWQKI